MEPVWPPTRHAWAQRYAAAPGLHHGAAARAGQTASTPDCPCARELAGGAPHRHASRSLCWPGGHRTGSYPHAPPAPAPAHSQVLFTLGPHAWTIGGIEPPADPAGSACHQTLAWCSLPSGPRMPGRACVAVGHPQMRVTLAPAVQTHGSFGACVDVRPLHACRAARHSWNTGSICIHMRRQPTHFALLVSRL
jgi:hypothetical protein